MKNALCKYHDAGFNGKEFSAIIKSSIKVFSAKPAKSAVTVKGI